MYGDVVTVNRVDVKLQSMIKNLPESKRKAIEEFVRGLRKKYGDRVKKVILFGSVARGDFHEESDIDVLVIGSITLDEVIEVSYPILLKYGELISPHVVTEEYYLMLKANRSEFIESVEEEGMVIV